MRHRDRPYHRVVSLLPSPLAPTGGVFRLDRKLTTDISRSIAGGWSAFARSGGQDLIVSGPRGAADYETAVLAIVLVDRVWASLPSVRRTSAR
jgi:hypothetical protein